LNVANARDNAQQSDKQSAAGNSNFISLSTNDVVSDASLKFQAAPISIYNQSEPDEEIPGQTSVDQPDMTGEEIKRRLIIALPNSNQQFIVTGILELNYSGAELCNFSREDFEELLAIGCNLRPLLARSVAMAIKAQFPTPQ